MPSESQVESRTRVVIVAGEAGSGKTTLGRALAEKLSLALLDLDALTNPLLDALVPAVLQTHWLNGPHAALIRSGRYAALRAVAHDVVSAGTGAVLTAPFTEELAGGGAWRELVDALHPAELQVLHLAGSPAALAARRARRGAARDQVRPERPSPTPVIPHTRIEVLLSPEQQLARALQALGERRAIDRDSAVFDRCYDALLFDVDGTLAESTAAVLRCWHAMAGEYGFDFEEVQRNHGQPAEALLGRLLAPSCVDAARQRVTELEVADVGDITPTPGARAVFDAIPDARKAVVTSGTRRIALARLTAAGFAVPTAFVTRDDVTNGKPDPEPFLLAAEKLQVDPRRCLVVEDANAGIRAAQAAGCTVLAVRGTSPDAELSAADLIVDALDQISVRCQPAGLTLVPS